MYPPLSLAALLLLISLARGLTNDSDTSGRQLLGQPCAKDLDCIAAYSLCNQGVCSCHEGFQSDRDGCRPKAVFCFRDGSAVEVKAPLACQVHANGNDSCPDEQFCHLYEGGRIGVGHCCPRPTLACPAGSPESADLICDPQLWRPGLEYCDSHVRFCHKAELDGRVISRICCKNPCGGGRIFREGKCWERRLIGQSCESQHECVEENSECRAGKCECRGGFFFPPHLGYCTKPNCPAFDGLGRPASTPDSEVIQCRNAAVSCPDGSYCEADAKICCQKPVPTCPTGRPSTVQTCRFNETSPCSSGHYCQLWFSTFVPSGSDGTTEASGICCPSSDSNSTSTPEQLESTSRPVASNSTHNETASSSSTSNIAESNSTVTTTSANLEVNSAANSTGSDLTGSEPDINSAIKTDKKTKI